MTHLMLPFLSRLRASLPALRWMKTAGLGRSLREAPHRPARAMTAPAPILPILQILLSPLPREVAS